jgi:hypothetical protein
MRSRIASALAVEFRGSCPYRPHNEKPPPSPYGEDDGSNRSMTVAAVYLLVFNSLNYTTRLVACQVSNRRENKMTLFALVRIGILPFWWFEMDK